MNDLSKIPTMNGPIPPNMKNEHRFDDMHSLQMVEEYAMHGFVAPVIDQLQLEPMVAGSMYRQAMDAVDTYLTEKNERQVAIRFCNAVVDTLRKNYTLHGLAESENERVREIFAIELSENPAAEDWFKLEEEAGATFLPPDPTDPPLYNGIRTREQQREFMEWKVQKRAGATTPPPHEDLIMEKLKGKSTVVRITP